MNVLKSQEQLAEEACNIEIDICKNPIGKQDQYGCALGGFKKIKFNKNGKVEVQKIMNDFSNFEKNIYLCFTNITRNANNILSKQSKSSKKNKLKNQLLIKSVDKFEKIIFSNKLDDVGNLLHETWKLKKEMAEGISNDTIEKMYLEGVSSGAIGGKVLGAGGGGFILFYVPKSNHKTFEKKMKKHIFLDFNFENHGSKIIFVED